MFALNYVCGSDIVFSLDFFFLKHLLEELPNNCPHVVDGGWLEMSSYIFWDLG